MKVTLILATCFLLLTSNNFIYAEDYSNSVIKKNEDNCLFKKEGLIKINNNRTLHKLIVKTNSRSCKDADIIINITPENYYPLLYEFKGDLSAISRYRSENVTYTDFMNGQFNYLSKPQKHPLEYAKQEPPNEPICKFFVTKKYYNSIIDKKYPIFCHASYEEGETCIVFIPELGQMIKIAICGT